MGRRWFRNVGIMIVLVVGVLLVAAMVALPTLWLVRADKATLDRWAQVGQAVAVVGVFFSGVAFVGIAFALLMQQRELINQKSELGILKTEQRRNSEVSLRQLHMDIVKMAINDRDLLSVWPEAYSPPGWNGFGCPRVRVDGSLVEERHRRSPVLARIRAAHGRERGALRRGIRSAGRAGQRRCAVRTVVGADEPEAGAGTGAEVPVPGFVGGGHLR